MTVVEEYLASLNGPEQAVIGHMYDVVRQVVPDATEELSYNMPTFKHNGKGVVSILSNKDFMSLYPFCNLERLELDASKFETTKGSIHFTLDNPIPDDFLRQIVAARVHQINMS